MFPHNPLTWVRLVRQYRAVSAQLAGASLAARVDLTRQLAVLTRKCAWHERHPDFDPFVCAKLLAE
jgi:hypothetical protein